MRVRNSRPGSRARRATAVVGGAFLLLVILLSGAARGCRIADSPAAWSAREARSEGATEPATAEQPEPRAGSLLGKPNTALRSSQPAFEGAQDAGLMSETTSEPKGSWEDFVREWAIERSDPIWTADVRTYLEETERSLSESTHVIDSVDCRNTVCDVQLSFSNQEETGAFLDSVQQPGVQYRVRPIPPLPDSDGSKDKARYRVLIRRHGPSEE